MLVLAAVESLKQRIPFKRGCRKAICGVGDVALLPVYGTKNDALVLVVVVVAAVASFILFLAVRCEFHMYIFSCKK